MGKSLKRFREDETCNLKTFVLRQAQLIAIGDAMLRNTAAEHVVLNTALALSNTRK